MGDVIVVVGLIWDSLQRIMSSSAPVINWLGAVTFFGWGFVYPLMAIIRRIFLSSVLEARPDVTVDKYY